MSTQPIAVSLRLQDIASSLSDIFTDIAGEPLAFVLIVSVDKTAQYVSNTKRADGEDMIRSLLARWGAGRADIPAHYNPDLKPDIARPLKEWHEDYGPVVWWKFPVDEPSWIGRPDDSDWPGYHTHWTAHPITPRDPTT